MAGEKISKVVYAGQTLIDLTGDDVTAADVRYGVQFHLADGNISTGTNTNTADPTDGTATASEVLDTKTFYAGNSTKKTGTMPNRGAVSGTISTYNGTYTIQQGYHDGAGSVAIDSTEQAKISDPTNIKSGVTILGVTGTYSGESVTAESKTVTPDATGFTVLPTGADYLSQVVVNPIPYTEVVNLAGGLTVTIG